MLLTVGPWRPIYLHTYTSYISSHRISSTISPDFSETTLATAFTITPAANVIARVTLKTSQATIRQGETASEGTGDLKWRIKIGQAEDEVQLWWPVGYGKQVLYTVEIEIADEVCFDPLRLK